MAGNSGGGKASAITNKAKYGEDFYRRIGSLGGKAPAQTPKGFAANRELARRAGALGGRISVQRLREAFNG